MQPYLDKRWVLALHDISPVFDFKWDSLHGYWIIVQHKVGQPDWVVMAVTNANREYRDIDSSVFKDLRFAIMVASHGGYREWSQKEQNRTLVTQEKRKQHEYEEALQAGKEVAPLLRSIADAGTTSIHGRSKFRFPGFGESKVFGGVNSGANT